MSTERLVIMFYDGSLRSLRLGRATGALHNQAIDL